jgi:hypothetical protein
MRPFEATAALVDFEVARRAARVAIEAIASSSATPDDATRLMNLLVPIWVTRSKVTGQGSKRLWPLNANAGFMKTRQDGGQRERRMSR